MVRAPLTLPEGTVRLQASVGTAVAPEDGDDAESLPANANLAMRRAKAAGGDRAVRFDAGADPARRLRRRRRRALACAIDAEDLEVRYQPQVALATGALVGVEALVRWFPADGGEITPSEFIPLAEESGLVVPLGRCVLRRACAEAVASPAAGRLAVNLSPVQLARDDIVATVAETLAATGLPADRLELEVTENALHDDVERAVDRLDRLRRLGVTIALDDFGTGFSSLAILWRLPIDTLKLDRAFVRDLEFDPRSVEILTEVVAMARHLSLATVAEGIETPDQRALLTELGCDVGQGFLFGAAAAMPAATAAFTPPPAPPPRAGA
jgi:predicted signal transduction protein with EAL and GGDEF domain